MDSVQIMRALAATSSRTEKEQILIEAFHSGDHTFFVGAQMAYDAMITFGVKKVPLIEDAGEGDFDAPGTFTWGDFLALTDKLRRRELTGHAARDALLAAAEACHAPTWNEFYRRILLKDLKAGVEESTINKVLGKLAGTYPEAKVLMVPVFECQLAHDGEKPEHQKKIKGRKLLDIKLDGVRLLSVLDKEEGRTTQFTRNGKVNENFDSIRRALDRVLPLLPGSIVLDGEITGKDFQDLMTQFQRKEGVDDSNARLALFDIVPLVDFRAGICRTSQEQRHTALSALAPMLNQQSNGLIYVVPKVEVDLDTAEGQEAFSRFNKEAIAAGYEGIMIKDPQAPYECKRSAAWLKKKPIIDVTLTVVAVNEGDADSKYRGMMGALVCRGEDDGRLIEVNVGSGFSDEQRVDFWARRESLIGMLVEVRADAMTLARSGTSRADRIDFYQSIMRKYADETDEIGRPYTREEAEQAADEAIRRDGSSGDDAPSIWSLRFPRFKGFRGTTPGEKL